MYPCSTYLQIYWSGSYPSTRYAKFDAKTVAFLPASVLDVQQRLSVTRHEQGRINMSRSIVAVHICGGVARFAQAQIVVVVGWVKERPPPELSDIT